MSSHANSFLVDFSHRKTGAIAGPETISPRHDRRRLNQVHHRLDLQNLLGYGLHYSFTGRTTDDVLMEAAGAD